MTTYFVSRHPGAIEWAKRQKLEVTQFVPHLDPVEVQAGDTVIGSLPVNLAAQVCERGAAYWHLSLALPAALRGRELSAADMLQMGAHVHPYHVESTTTLRHIPP
jgi:CRISPR-associated protein Csx16